MYVANNKRFGAFVESIGMTQARDAGLPPAELAQKLDDVMRNHTAQEWEDIIAEIGSEGVICHSSAEWLEHRQALASGIIADYHDPELGAFRGPGINTRLSGTPGSVRTPRAKLDAHRTEILAELANSPAQREKVGVRAASVRPERSASGVEGRTTEVLSALHGVKVVDLCIVLAGPTCGRTLAEFGADVIKIDSPYTKTVLRHLDINRAKRSILIDLKTKEGLEIFWKLVEGADVVLQNFRAGVAERLGIGYEQVRARRPDIIYGSMNTFGHIGPYARRPGHEQIAQAVSGMQVRYGSAKPATAPFAANDYGTGLMGCYGIALALLHRQRTGEGQFVDSALAYTATMLQSALLHDYKGKQWDEPHGQEASGSGPLNRFYEASDGWLFLAAQSDGLAHCAELEDLAGRSSADLERALEERLRSRTVAAWVEVLNAADIGAHRVVPNLAELMTDPLVQSRGLVITRDHEGFGPVTTTAPGMKLSRTPVVVGRAAATPGSDAASVLADIGMRGEMERLIRAGIVAVAGVKAGR